MRRKMEETRRRDMEDLTETALPDHIRVFMITPYAKEFKSVEQAVRNVLEGAPYFFEVRLARDYTHDGAQLVDDLQRHIAESHAFIADITGLNPNVMMEVGAIHLRRDPRPLFVLVSDTQVVDNSIADLGDKLRIPYGSPSDDAEDIESAIRDKLERREDLEKLLSQRKGRYLSETLLRSLPRLGLEQREIKLIQSKYSSVEALLGAEITDVQKKLSFLGDDVDSLMKKLKAAVNDG